MVHAAKKRAGRYVEPDACQPIARLHADNDITSDRQFVLKAPDIAAITPVAGARS